MIKENLRTRRIPPATLPHLDQSSGVMYFDVNKVLENLFRAYTIPGKVDGRRARRIKKWIKEYGDRLTKRVNHGSLSEAQRGISLIGQAAYLLELNEDSLLLPNQDLYSILYYGDTEIASQWVDFHSTDPNIFKPQINYLRNEISRRIKEKLIATPGAKHPKIVELGFGGARDYPLLREIGDYQGVDLSQAMIDIAKRKYPKGHFVQGNIFDLHHIKDGTTTAVYTAAVLHHIPSKSLPRALKEMRRITAENGVLFVSLREGKGEVGDENTGLIYFCQTERTMNEFLAGAGFRTIEVGHRTTPRGKKYLDIFAEAA